MKASLKKRSKNLGFLFFRDYYRDQNLNELVNEKGEVRNSKKVEEQNQEICDFRFQEPTLDELNYKHSFRLKTTYPGLVIGSGLVHGVGSDEEFKIGFQFDYTTGLPVVPGSSVKGLLRSAFPEPGQKYEEEKKDYINKLLSDLGINTEVTPTELKAEIFAGQREGETLPKTERDVFFTATIVKGGKGNKILGEDYITPHDNPLQDPQPLKFLKVLPDVEFEFRFNLQDGALAAEDKKKLFKQIILDLGMGAKTNVGYGNLVQVKN